MAKDPKDDSSEERVPGRLLRTIKTGWLGATVSGSYLGGKILDKFRADEKRTDNELERHLANAKRIVSTMSELRGPLMKIGQLLSTHAEALPDQYGDVLKKLQASAPPMSYGTIRAVLEKDLGAPPEKLFKTFSEKAVAAASLGQVHKAELPDGTIVAVKVQYPGADESVEGDVKNLKFGASLVKKMLADVAGNSRMDFTPVAEEIAEHLVQETDYCREAYNAKLMRKLFADDPEILVPRVHDAFSGLRVVTYDWVDGVDLNEALRTEDKDKREKTVSQLTYAFWKQLYRGGVLHADPHPGNYRVLPDGRMALLDYGCVKIFSEDFLVQFAEMTRASFDDDVERLKRCMNALGLMDDPESKDELEDMLRIANYFSVGLHVDEDFDFGTYNYVQGARELVLYFLNRRRIPPAQKDFLFLTRVVLGYYEYFSRAKARRNFRREVQHHVHRGWKGRDITIPPYGE